MRISFRLLNCRTVCRGALLCALLGAPLGLDAGGLLAEDVVADENGPSIEALLAIEDATAELENRLNDLGFALLEGGEGPAAYLEDRLTARIWPAAPGPAAPAAAGLGIERRAWTPGESREMSRRDFLAAWKTLLERFAAPPQFEWAMTSSTMSDGTIEGTLRLSLAGLTATGREWIRGHAELTARKTEEGGYRLAAFELTELESLVTPRPIFSDVTAGAKVAADDLPFPQAMAAGQQWYPNSAAAGDLDQDGLVDLFVTGPEANRLYLNQGDGTFSDGAARTGLKTLLPDKAELTPAFFDFDNDGDSDVFLTAVHENLLLENRLVPDGRLFFRQRSIGLPQNPETQGWSVAVADVNGDGLPDVYVPSYFSPLKGPFPVTTMGDTDGQVNLFYLNQGDGTFKEAAEAWGLVDKRFGMGAQFADVDGDGDNDLYLANDFGGGNALFINQGERFVDQAKERGAELGAQSMGVSFADYDNDGDLDLHVTNMSSHAASRFVARLDPETLKRRDFIETQWSGNALLQNQGDGTFREVSAETGPFLAEWAWGGGFLDVDNDGWEDLHTPNGFLSGQNPYDGRPLAFPRMIAGMQQDSREKEVALAGQGLQKMGMNLQKNGGSMGGWTSDKVFLNRGGERFVEISGLAGADSRPSDARSTVYADFDNDGDLDVFVRATHGRAHFLFRNEIGHQLPFLRVTLEGRESGRDAFGATVRVEGEKLTLTKAKRGSNGYLAQNDPRLVFGLGEAGAVKAIEVRWPSGAVQRFNGPPAADSLLIVEGAEAPRAVEEERFEVGAGAPAD